MFYEWEKHIEFYYCENWREVGDNFINAAWVSYICYKLGMITVYAPT